LVVLEERITLLKEKAINVKIVSNNKLEMVPSSNKEEIKPLYYE